MPRRRPESRLFQSPGRVGRHPHAWPGPPLYRPAANPDRPLLAPRTAMAWGRFVSSKARVSRHHSRINQLFSHLDPFLCRKYAKLRTFGLSPSAAWQAMLHSRRHGTYRPVINADELSTPCSLFCSLQARSTSSHLELRASTHRPTGRPNSSTPGIITAPLSRNPVLQAGQAPSLTSDLVLVKRRRGLVGLVPLATMQSLCRCAAFPQFDSTPPS